MNNMFFTAAEIYMRLISSFPSKGAEINKIQVMRWCSELVTDYLRDPVGLIPNKKYPVGFGDNKLVTDKKVPLPANIFKLESVFDENNNLIKDFLYQGEYIYFSDRNVPTKVFIDYMSIAVDENGFPLIKRGYESAAYHYCVYKAFEEDATRIPPRIQQWRWLQIVNDKDWEIEAAARSWDDITDNDIRDIHQILISDVYAMAMKNTTLIHDKNILNKTSNMLD